MVRSILAAAVAATLVTTPVHAQDLPEALTGIARQYLQQEQDRAAFSQAQSTNTRSAYQTYLRQFPSGLYAAQAREQVRRLGGATTAPVTNPGTSSGQDTAALSAQQRASIQRQLNALGYDTNGADGSFGPGTRRAIALWQRDRNYTQTGTLDAAQANEILRGTTGNTRPGNSGGTVASGPAQDEAGLNLTRQQRGAGRSDAARL